MIFIEILDALFVDIYGVGNWTPYLSINMNLDIYINLNIYIYLNIYMKLRNSTSVSTSVRYLRISNNYMIDI